MIPIRTAFSAPNITNRAESSSAQVRGAEDDFEEKMAMLLRYAGSLNRSVPAFQEAQRLLENENSIVGRVTRRAQT
jgi:hypothetical protein